MSCASIKLKVVPWRWGWLSLAGFVLAALALLFAPPAGADQMGQITVFTAGLDPGSNPVAIAPGADANLWFTAQGTTPAIGRITPQGQITEFTAGLNSGLLGFGIAPGPDGNMWFPINGEIGRITPQGQITEYPTPASLPASIVPGADGNMWFSDGGGAAAAIGRITPEGQITEFPVSLPYLGSGITAMAPGPDGNVWFGVGGCPFPTQSQCVAAIGRITPQGQITEFTAGLSSGSFPSSIAPGADGNVWFTDTNYAIGRITPQGQITEFTTSVQPSGIAAGPDGNMWFADNSGNDLRQTRAIWRITPQGQITAVTTGINLGLTVNLMALGADGNLWFTGGDATRSFVGRIGTSMPAAFQASPTVSGSRRAGSAQNCQNDGWARWAGVGPVTSLWPSDGYGWLRDGVPITGANSSTYTPAGVDAGHQLACTVRVTYPLPFYVSSSATSAAITVLPPLRTLTVALAGTGSGGVTGQALQCPPSCQQSYPDTTTVALMATPARGSRFDGWKVGGCSTARTCILTLNADTLVTATFTANVPKLWALNIVPKTFALTGRLAKGRCVATSRANQQDGSCTRLINLRVSYKLTMSAHVTFTIRQQQRGRLIKGRCVQTSGQNRSHRPCNRMVAIPGTLIRTGATGANSFTFTGRLAGHKLTPNTYQLTATPTANGHAGAAHSINFKVLP